MKETTFTTKNKIYVTGATGWIGRTFLHELQACIPSKDFNVRVKAFGSKSNEIVSTNYAEKDKTIIPVYPLKDLEKEQYGENILLFHSAFLTNDKIKKFGVNRFIKTNQEISTMKK